MKSQGIYKIRPAGRHVLTIGEDLIQDKYAALVELVKNAYDADSPDVIIRFKKDKNNDNLQIQIEDHGHGMSSDDVVNKWLVPSTSYKLMTRKSPNGRVMQGRKGIGRYAASILGEDLLLETINIDGEKTNLYVEWEEFNRHAYLDEVDVLVENEYTNQSPGTILTINNINCKEDGWDHKQLDKLRFELKKLIPPKTTNTFDDNFKIILIFENYSDLQSEPIEEEITPYPILDLFDYKISGTISADGNAKLQYKNQKIRNDTTEDIELTLGNTFCGKLVVDIRVYDREAVAITQLIQRGLKDENTGQYVSKLQARNLLNSVNGIGVYRNGFRIRPLGDSDYDWLKLNAKRIQNPSLKIGSNQVIGYVHIESEEESSLEEKSARDGLKDNIAYQHLINITCEVISELEKRRYAYRRKEGLSKPNQKIEKKLEGLYDYTKLQNSISTSLKKAGLSDEVLDEVEGIISEEQRKKNKDIEEIKKAVAIYQGQATLGKIINIILHEGRRPLNYFKNQVPNLEFYIDFYKNTPSEDLSDTIKSITSGISDNSDVIATLFKRLDPLSSRKRETRSEFSLLESISGVVAVFESELESKNIKVCINCDKSVNINGWKQDIYTIFANLLDNSIFWIEEKECDTRFININVSNDDTNIEIDYTDSGPGIEPILIESEVIFEPQFTTKINGTGLGLAIAGESAQRNGFILTALQSDEGAHFKLSNE